jgi:hypothetical protein
VDVILYSVSNRDTDGNGIVDKGIGWSTYDNADAIKRSPENVYLGVKQMTAYICAAEMFQKLAIKTDGKDIVEDVVGATDGTAVGFKHNQVSNVELRNKQAKKYSQLAETIYNTLHNAYEKYGYLPCSLDESFEGWSQHSIVLSEGLFLPGLSGIDNELLNKAAEWMGKSYSDALERSVVSYGIKLSSEEPNTWFSKVMVSDVVAMYWFDKNFSSAKYAYEWNKNNYYAYNDGLDREGKTWIGFWYPRGVSSFGYFFYEKGFTAPQREKFLTDIK